MPILAAALLARAAGGDGLQEKRDPGQADGKTGTARGTSGATTGNISLAKL
ncbi:hypothetical protein [Synechococcus sp. H60.4]|uniref:hypothetical protein n=1 Tax=Synechococcus sp. H60.4 TaxID=2964519 RepID=UPI0039C0CC52